MKDLLLFLLVSLYFTISCRADDVLLDSRYIHPMTSEIFASAEALQKAPKWNGTDFLPPFSQADAIKAARAKVNDSRNQFQLDSIELRKLSSDSFVDTYFYLVSFITVEPLKKLEDRKNTILYGGSGVYAVLMDGTVIESKFREPKEEKKP